MSSIGGLSLKLLCIKCKYPELMLLTWSLMKWRKSSTFSLQVAAKRASRLDMFLFKSDATIHNKSATIGKNSAVLAHQPRHVNQTKTNAAPPLKVSFPINYYSFNNLHRLYCDLSYRHSIIQTINCPFYRLIRVFYHPTGDRWQPAITANYRAQIQKAVRHDVICPLKTLTHDCRPFLLPLDGDKFTQMWRMSQFPSLVP